AQDDKVEVIKDFKDFYRYQNFYLAGQPTLEGLHWLKSQGVTKIINLRTETENNDYAEYAYDEETKVKDLGFEYHMIPISGLQDYTPEKLAVFISHMNDEDKILIHCRSAGRVTYFLMGYLIREKGYTVNEAVAIGKKVKYSVPLEKLLGTEISMEIKE
ncbi:hypothetical protein ACFLU5_05390, partial [Bacteroidota bacterium]